MKNNKYFSFIVPLNYFSKIKYAVFKNLTNEFFVHFLNTN